MNILHFSTGVSSAITGIIAKNELDLIIRISLPKNEHPDSNRFSDDYENYMKPVKFLTIESRYEVNQILYIFPTFGKDSKCTEYCKRRHRIEWEFKNPGRHTYFWGYDSNEKDRCDLIVENNPKHNHRFPLIENNLTKQDCHAMLDRIGIKRPVMYDLGFQNNNCIGCPKGGMGYWNKIRRIFPEKFNEMAILERDRITPKGDNYSFINGVYLDELDPEAGRDEPEIDMDCGIFCFTELKKLNKLNFGIEGNEKS